MLVWLCSFFKELPDSAWLNKKSPPSLPHPGWLQAPPQDAEAKAGIRTTLKIVCPKLKILARLSPQRL
jgi:hypothetical protein